MADLRGIQLKDGFQTLVTIGATSTSDPTTGALTNGKNTAITQVTLGLGSASAPSYSFTGDTNTGLFASGADAIGLVTGGTSRLAIDSSGNINIGGTTTIAKAVSGTFEGLVLDNSGASLDVVGSISKLSFQHNSVNAGEIRSVNTEDFTTSAKQSADLTFHTILDGTLSERIRINDDGKVGIGETDPDQTLHVKSGTANFVAKFESTDDKASILIQDDDTLNYLHSQGGFLSIGGQSALNASNLNINSTSGYVGIGTASNSTFALEVQANSTSGVLAVQNAANDRNTFRSSNSGGTRTFDIGNNSSGHGIVNIRNSSGTVNTQLLGSGNSYFNGGNVGIGETSIDAKLHLTTATAGLVNQKFESAGSAAWRLGVPASQTYFAFDNANDNLSSPKLIIDTNGNVGIGATSVTSGFKTEIAGGFLRVGETQGEDAVEMGWFNSGNRGFIQVYDRGDSAYRDLLINDSLMIQSDGDVGIGTNSPSAKLQVEGDLDVRTASNKNLHIRSFPSFDNFSNQGVGISLSRTSSDADLMALGVVDTDKLGLFSRSGIILATGGSNAFQHTSEVVRIDGSGNLLVGRTSNFSGAKAEIQTNDNVTTLTLNKNNSNHGEILRIAKSGTTVGSIASVATGKIGFFGSGGTGAVIDSSGNVGIGTSSPSSLLHLEDANSPKLIIKDTTNNCQFFAYAQNSNAHLGTSSSHDLIIDTNGTERVKIDSGGNAIFTKSGGAYLQLKDASAVRGAINVETSDGLVFTTGASFTERMRITGDGDIEMPLATNAVGRFVDNVGEVGSGNFCLQVANSANDALKPLGFRAEKFVFATGNVGIGTTDPAAKFEVTDGSSSITLGEFSNGAAIFLDGSNGDFTGGDYFHIIADGVGYLGLGGYGGGATPLNVNYQGRVGVGTNSPSGLFHVKGDTNSNGAEVFLQVNNNNTTDNIGTINFGNNADSTLSKILSGTSGNNTSSYLTFSTSDTGTQSEAVRIDKSGNVGFGTTSPDEPVHVAKSSGDAIIAVEANDGNAALYLTSAGTNKDNRIVIGNAKDLKFEAQASGSGQGQGQDPTATGTTIVTFLSSGGITFNGDTASANALDDYEEGTHTTSLSDGTYTAALGDNELAYTKIGNMVTITGQFFVASYNSSASASRVTLPFTIANLTDSAGNFAGTVRAKQLNTSNTHNVVAFGDEGNGYVLLQETVDNGTPVNIGGGAYSSGTEITLNFSYFTS